MNKMIIIDYWELLKITRDYWRLLKITRNYWRLLEITGIYWALQEITRDYWGLQEITGECWRGGNHWRSLEMDIWGSNRYMYLHEPLIHNNYKFKVRCGS